jgi:hypothetical protein
MSTFSELDALPSSELRDRAVHRAERHLDIGFFWRLLKVTPAAEAAKGDPEEADNDTQSARALLVDALRTDDGSLLDAMRPIFIEYLQEHQDG